jgi:hypothetical protein
MRRLGPWLGGVGVLVLVVMLSAMAADAPPRDPAPIDWTRARELYQREQRGEKLTPDEQTYLDRAKAERQKANQNQPGRVPQRPPAATTGLVPLDQMSAQDRYKDEDGGLYGGGKNQPPAEHQKAADRELAKITPLDPDGKPAAKGKIVLLSIGMSNTTQEFSKFKQLADADPDKSPAVLIVDGAQGGQDAVKWSTLEAPAWAAMETRLQQAGATPQQVQAIWMKHAVIGPFQYGAWPKHGEELKRHTIASLSIARQKFPNLRVVYLSSRIYGGYGQTQLNPEPYAYESGLVVRNIIRDQIAGNAALNWDPAKGDVKAPVLLWGPYLWADGTTPRKSDDLVWLREDLSADGTHPSPKSGREKVGKLLLNFMKTDANAKAWFLSPK